jgi:hypothetical protein
MSTARKTMRNDTEVQPPKEEILQLQHDIKIAVRVANLNNADDVRMPQVLQNVHFAKNLLLGLGSLPELDLIDGFDGSCLARLPVDAKTDHGEVAAADASQYATSRDKH